MEYVTASGHVVLLDDDLQLPGRLSIGSHGYPQLTGVRPNTVVLLHRWLLDILDEGRSMIGDHINHDKLDNRMANLRAVTPSQSNENRKMPHRGGAYPARGRWTAKIMHNRTVHRLGTFDTEEEARAAAAAARAKLHTHAPAA